MSIIIRQGPGRRSASIRTRSAPRAASCGPTAISASGDGKRLSVGVAPDDVAFLRISASDVFPLPPIITADSYRVSLRAENRAPRILTGAVTVTNRGSAELPVWTVRAGLPAWLSVKVVKNGRSQTFVNTVSTAGLKKGFYHALNRIPGTRYRIS